LSLKVRLFATYALVVVVTLTIAALGSGFLLRDYAGNLALKSLEDTARPISVQLLNLVRGEATLLEVVDTLQEQADENGVHILFLDDAGAVIHQVIPDGAAALNIVPGSIPQNDSRVVRGKYTPSGDREMLYVVFPLARAPRGIVRAEALALVIPSPGVGAAAGGLLKPFILSGTVALLGSLLLAWWLSRSVSGPVAGVIKAADRIAGGDYAYRINSTSGGEIGKLAQSFDRMASEVEAARLKLRHFVADVSHELKSPLTAIQGFSQALADGTASDTVTREKAVRIIGEEARRMRRQVDELLDLSRLQPGRLKMALEKIELGEVLRHSAELFEPSAADKSVSIKISAAPGLWLMGDAGRLEQVFNNLLDNAVKNAPPFSEISLAAVRSGGRLEASVTDEGPGIHPEHLKSVFERFYQVTGVRTGVGLGLAISREIVLAHDGEISARSEPGAGACFTLSLPALSP
jgi:signal transduction histidine kinase